MRSYTVGEFKTCFSEILESVRSGEEVAITFGHKKEVAAFWVPRTFIVPHKRPLGLLAGKAKVSFADDFEMTETEFLGV